MDPAKVAADHEATNSANLAQFDADPPRQGHPVAAALTLGGFYAGFVTWTYYAWYRKHKPLSEYKFGGDGWLGLETYAGGADKFGHAWSTMSLGRFGTEILAQWGGYSRVKSTAIGVGLAEALFVGVEVKDGFFYEFSFSDLAGDTTGALIAAALSLSPRLDEMFDFRVQYYPSKQYENQIENQNSPTGGKLNIAEDYSGQTYLLAYHLGSIHSLREKPYWGTLSRFVDVAFGFETRGYKPTPATGELPPDQHHQNLYLGVSLNAQGLFDWMFERRSRPARTLTHAAFEVFNLPFTFDGVKYGRSPAMLPPDDGA